MQQKIIINNINIAFYTLFKLLPAKEYNIEFFGNAINSDEFL